MESSEKIITNCDVLELIFRYLDFKEHLKLLKICPQFAYAIVHGVWRLSYKNLHILRKFRDTYLLQYNSVKKVKTERSLTLEEFHIILQHSLMYIQKLESNNIDCLRIITSLQCHNLTELTLFGIFIKDTHLQQVAKNCLNLQNFSLKDFSNGASESNIRANVFGEMKALSKLVIYDMDFSAWNYFDVQQLFCLPQLKTLMINIGIGDSNDNNGSNNNSTYRVSNIKHLRIGRLRYLQSVNICFIEDLICFENLLKLSITSCRVSINDNVLAQINNACPQLFELSFTHCCLTFKEFPRMYNLMHLTFDGCEDIKLEKFDEIFRKLKLKSLSLMNVEVRYKAEDISDYNYISNTLKTLNIEDIFDLEVVKTFCNRQHKFENVSKIRILENRIRRSQSQGLCFSHNFPYLQELKMDSFYISAEDILYLEHLKVLQFSLFDNMSWSYLKILFKHPTLTHITITPVHRTYLENYCEPLPNSCEGLTTKLKYLSLPSAVYEKGLRFWSYFRQRNKLLKLEIFDFATSKRRAPRMRLSPY